VRVPSIASALALALMAAATMLTASSSVAAGLSVDIIPNFVGAGVGVTPQWMGSRDSVVGVLPAARVQLQGNRFAELYGPIRRRRGQSHREANRGDRNQWTAGGGIGYAWQ
jgi:hypothetical protein